MAVSNIILAETGGPIRVTTRGYVRALTQTYTFNSGIPLASTLISPSGNILLALGTNYILGSTTYSINFNPPPTNSSLVLPTPSYGKVWVTFNNIPTLMYEVDAILAADNYGPNYSVIHTFITPNTPVFVWQNTTGINQLIWVYGGRVIQLEMQWNYLPAGVWQTLPVTSVSAFPINIGESIRVTYTSTDPPTMYYQAGKRT